MARDHALAAGLAAGAGVVRFYRWRRPTLSLGRNEPARVLYDRDTAQRMGIDVVRRPTGGRAVLHDAELTYAVVTPLRGLGPLREGYRAVHEGLVEGLRALGVEAEVARREGPAEGPGAGPCFQVPADGEVVFRGRKLVGSAQARIGRAILQHGSLLLEGDQGRLGELGALPGGPAPATLAGALGAVPPLEALCDALAAGLEQRLGGCWGEGGVAVAEDLETRWTDRYRSPEWTWRA